MWGGATRGSPSICRGGRPKGCKAAEVEAIAEKHRSQVMTNQIIAACEMAEANMGRGGNGRPHACRSFALHMHAGVSLFKTVLNASMDQATKDYFRLRCEEEMERIKLRRDE